MSVNNLQSLIDELQPLGLKIDGKVGGSYDENPLTDNNGNSTLNIFKP